MIKNIITNKRALIYVALLLCFLAIYLWRLSGILWIPEISGHLSNFALTGIGSLALIGPRTFIKGKSDIKVSIVIILFIAANLVVEALNFGALGGFNVIDISDALFGFIACCIVGIAYIFNKKKEMR